MNRLRKPDKPQTRTPTRMASDIVSRRVGDVESAKRLTPVAVKETAKQEAFALIREGYVQAHQVFECPHCSARFFLLLDPRDRTMKGRSEIEERAAAYFRTMIAAQHFTSHALNHLVMPKQNCCR